MQYNTAKLREKQNLREKKMKRMRRDAIAEQLALTVPQAAKIAGKTERAVWLDISRKKFPHRRWGRKVIILREELEQFLKTLDGVSVEEAIERVSDEH